MPIHGAPYILLENKMRKSLKQAMKNGKVVVGSWITLGHPAIAEIMAKAGFEWLAVDLEHSVIDLFEAENLIRTIQLCGATPLVRLSSNDPIQIKRVMDAGSFGIIVPMIKTREDAKAAVDAVYYPNRGTRGVGLARAQQYGASFNDYKQWLEDEAITILQIEHIAAVRNLKDILSVPGVDGLIMGPYDLSASMGKPGKFEDADVQDAINDVLKIAREMRVPTGIHVIEPNPEELKMRIAQGHQFLAYSLDIRMIDYASRKGLETTK